jgi:two-component system, sensor histidine kinase and response regulator
MKRRPQTLARSDNQTSVIFVLLSQMVAGQHEPRDSHLIRADPTIALVKAVLVTSMEPSEVSESVRGEVDAFITKPVKQSQLFETLCAVLGIKAEPAETVPAESISSLVADKRLRILLVEDNEVNQQVALNQLRMLDHDVDLAPNGVEALKLFDQNDYDAVLMDIHMPELDGYATTAEIRRREVVGIDIGFRPYCICG